MYEKRTNPADARDPAASEPGSIELRSGVSSVTIDLVRGGRLASLSAAGRELLLRSPDETDSSIRWGCFLMAPWAGRLAGGRLHLGGRTLQLPRTHGRHAIHGLLWNRPWRRITAAAGPGQVAAALACDLPPDVWPPGGRVEQRLALSPGSLTLTAELTAGGRMPAVLGWHPWFLRRGDVRVQLDAAATLETRRMIPTGSVVPVAGPTDLRSGPALGRRRLDHAYVDARSPVVVKWPDIDLTVEFEPAPATVVVHTPPASFCVEPQTAWPDAASRPARDAERAGLRWLDAGQTLRASMRLSWRLR